LQARREAFAAVAVEPYDVARVRAAFERMRAADQDAVGVFHDNVAEAFGRLTPEQRRAALDALRRAAPASRQTLAPEGEAAPSERPPATGQTLQERRQERRERWRERREERLRQQQQSSQP
jgi:uncharacterized membrane protein